MWVETGQFVQEPARASRFEVVNLLPKVDRKLTEALRRYLWVQEFLEVNF